MPRSYPDAARPGGLVGDTAMTEAVGRVQALVAAAAEPELIYQTLVDEAVELLGADSGALRLVDAADPDWMIAVAARSATGLGERWRQRAPTAEGVSGRAISTGEMVVVERGRGRRTASQL